MLPDQVLNPGPLTYESGALTIVLSGPGVDNERQCATEPHLRLRFRLERGSNSEPCVVVVLLFYVHNKHLRSYQDGQLT